DDPAGVRRGAADGHRRPAGHGGAGRRRGHGRGRRRGVGGGGGRDQARLQGGRLDAHVGQEVDGRLLHGAVGRDRSAVWDAGGAEDVEAPGPLHGGGAEHEGAAGGPVQGRAVGGAAGAVVDAVVPDLLGHADRGGGEVEQARRPGAVVEVL